MLCDLIIKGEYVLPMDEKLEVIERGMVVISGNKILTVGTAVALEKKYKAKKTIDAGNSIIMPGLVNTHTHAAMTYFRGLADDLPLEIWLKKYIWPAEAKFVNPDFVRRASELACLEMVKAGVICFNDMYFFEGVTAEVALKSNVRAVIGEGVLDIATPSCPEPKKAIEKTLGFLSEYKDSEFITVAFAPHSIYTCGQEILSIIRDEAVKNRSLVHLHLSETEQENKECLKKHGLTPAAYLDQLGFFRANVLIAHGVWLSDEDLTVININNAGISHNPASNLKLASGLAPVSTMLKKGIAVGLGSDGAASSNTLELFSAMRICALVQKTANSDPAAVSSREAVKMATIDGARVLGLDKKIGSLEAGKRADIITINLDKPHLTPIYDPYSHIVYCANSSDVENVVVNGRVIMRNRKVLTIDEEKVLTEANEFMLKVRS